MVGRLVEDEEVGLVEQCVGKRHTFLLSAAELSHGLVEIGDVQLGEDLLCSEDFVGISLMIEASVEHALLCVELRSLLQESDAYVVAIDDLSLVIAFFSCENLQERRLSGAILGDESYFLPFAYREADIAEQHLRAEGFGEILYV